MWLLFAGCSTDVTHRADGAGTPTRMGVGSVSDDAWFAFYYQHPEPDELVAQIRALADEGLLSAEKDRMPLIGFLSGVFDRHPTKITGWMVEFEKLPIVELSGIYDALWYANTEVASDYLAGSLAAEAYRDPAPSLDAIHIDSPAILDFYWGRFFATGDQMPIRQIVSALEYGRYQGARQRYLDAAATATSGALFYEFYMESIFAAAMWSLEVNAKTHPLIKEYCEGLLRSGKLAENEYAWLAIVLSKVSPELWHVDFREDTAYVVDTRGEPDYAGPWDTLKAKVLSLNRYAGSYPPRFEDAIIKYKITSEWQSLVEKVKKEYAQYPDAETLLYLLGELYRQGHNMDVPGAAIDAGKIYERALRMYPRSVDLNMSAAYFYLSIDPRFAHLGEACLYRLREVLGANHPDVERGLVYAYLYQDREADAIAQIDRYLTLIPNDPVMLEMKQALLRGEMEIRVHE